MTWDEITTKLAAPFKSSEIEWRQVTAGVGGGGVWVIIVAYVTNRAIANRFDAVVGPENWREEYLPVSFPEKGGHGFLCGISVRLPGPIESHEDPDWITKWDGAPLTHIEPIKGGLSDSEKRAATKWGVGRYLYLLPEAFGNVHQPGCDCGGRRCAAPYKGELAEKWAGKVGGKQNLKFRYFPPEIPEHLRPKDETPDLPESERQAFQGDADTTEPDDPEAAAAANLRALEAAREKWAALIERMGVEADARMAFAALHRRVPDDESDWSVEHFGLAHTTVAARGGEAFTKALEALERGVIE